MFHGLLKEWVKELIEMFSDFGSTSLLVTELGKFSPSLYGWVKTIMQNVAMPVASVILALFFVLELYKASLKVEGTGAGTSFGAEIIFRVLFRMLLCKMVVDSSLLLMEAIYQVSQSVIKGIQAVVVQPGSIDGAANLAAMNAAIESLGLGDQIGWLLELFIIKFLVWGLLGLVQIVCMARFIEIYLYIAISPIPLATFPSEDLNQIAKGFLKNFAAVCLQGALIYLVLAFFPVIVGDSLTGNISPLQLLFYAIVLAIAVFSTGRWAKSVCNAM